MQISGGKVTEDYWNHNIWMKYLTALIKHSYILAYDSHVVSQESMLLKSMRLVQAICCKSD